MIYFIFPIIIICLFIYAVIVSSKHKNMAKKAKDNFLDENPDAVKIYFNKENPIIYYVKHFMKLNTTIYTDQANGEAPHMFFEGGGASNGIYLKPGEVTLTLKASKSRSGIIHRTVTTTYGPVELSFRAFPSMEYLIVFKNDEFTYEEV